MQECPVRTNQGYCGVSLLVHSGGWRLVPQEGWYHRFQVQVGGEFDGVYHPPVSAYHQFGVQTLEGEVETQVL